MLDLRYIKINFYTTSENLYKYRKLFKQMGLRDMGSYLEYNNIWEISSSFNDKKFFFDINIVADSIPVFDYSDIAIIDETIPDWILGHYASRWDNEKHYMVYTEFKEVNEKFIENLAYQVFGIYCRNEKEGY